MAEQAFVQTFLNTLASQPVRYADDYHQPPENSLRRVPVLPIALPTPPTKANATASSSASIQITIKSLKPPFTLPLTVHPTDSIKSLKDLIAQSPLPIGTPPPADAQRLLLKGKALADTKLLQEYAVNDTDVITLMLKPGVAWDPAAPVATSDPTASSATTTTSSTTNSMATLASPAPRRGHQRIPSVVLSPSPSADDPKNPKQEKDILLTLDPVTAATNPPGETLSTYEATVAKPEFWEGLLAYLRTQFPTPADALTAFEDFLRASKGALTASQIAKIRDQVGIVGMAGR
ncbi:hypothetical protein DXG03_000974 [Asterophora parasitica]|uniref:Ubiquitin-like domain-containing protein n=1 Tax=Asterophora parasitica TaxID=117018 RepID=A0A9P7KD23_9AGAR|nr:hypothetical protein DXG03_000974 [Asterophora parasitica]